MKKIFSLVIVLAMLIGCLAACSQIADNTEHFDKITKTCKLTKNYEGKSFWNDGIAEATVAAYTDGDTTRFNLGDKDQVIIRYYSIDTPESTGSVEKWGKAASNFTKAQLQSADKIVLEATASKPEKDSYGTRYLGYVWYKPKGETEFKNLNLELVENGYSENKGNDTSAFAYNSYFKSAQSFAQSISLRVYSDLPDPLFSTNPTVVTLKELIEDLNSEDSQYYNAESEAGAKVKFEACLTELIISDTGTYTFKAVSYDRETGERYVIDVYAQYQSSNASKMKVGHLYTIVGDVDVHGSSFQIKGINYDSRYTQPTYTLVKQRDYYLWFDSDVQYTDNFSQTLYSDATVKSSSVENGILTIIASAQQRKMSGLKDDEVTFTFKVNVANDYVNGFTEGTVFTVCGYQFEEKSGIIDIVNYSDITIK